MEPTQAIFDVLMNLGLPGLIVVYLINEVNQLKKQVVSLHDENEALYQKRLDDWRYFSDNRLVRTFQEGDTKPFSQAARIAADQLIG